MHEASQYVGSASGRLRWVGRAARVVMSLGLLLVAGCILSPPIEPRDEPNLSPRIQPFLPDDKSAVVPITRESLQRDPEVQLAANLYDANNEPELFYLFLSDEEGIIAQSETGGAVGELGAEFFFGPVDYTFAPCDLEISAPGTEVITLYVSDRRFQSLSPVPREITEAEGALTVAYSWTLKYEAGICDSNE
ncbi:MAG: hypothetical protein ACLFVJ_08535 [Persicimonas sp.]